MPVHPAAADTVIDLAATRAERTRLRWQTTARRSALSERERSLVTVAALVATYGGEPLGVAIEQALANGVTPDEIADLLSGLEAHVGWPAAMSATLWAKDVFDRMG